MNVQKVIGTVFQPSKVKFSTSGSSSACDFEFLGGTEKPVFWNQNPVKNLDQKTQEYKETRRIPKVKIVKVNKKSVLVEIIEDCYYGPILSLDDRRDNEFGISREESLRRLEKYDNKKGQRYRLAFALNEHINFM